ncbi:hypothetical protein BKA82DRAFT_4010665 [Pisolithus tinctorius]|nr:hypothetical protein BKA82DRAFT_4010665 [Pisolithus tinctorius]
MVTWRWCHYGGIVPPASTYYSSMVWVPRQFTYALQQANNPSDQLPDDWYQQVQVETHILKQALATCNSYGTIMKVPHVANELLWWTAIQNMGETALLAHIMELNVLQVKRGEEVLQEAKEFFVEVHGGVISMTLGLGLGPVRTPSPYLRSSLVLVQPRKPNPGPR